LEQRSVVAVAAIRDRGSTLIRRDDRSVFMRSMPLILRRPALRTHCYDLKFEGWTKLANA
jgi:hypothetical protein